MSAYDITLKVGAQIEVTLNSPVQGAPGLPGPNAYIPDYDTFVVGSRDANGNPTVTTLSKNGSLVGNLDIQYNSYNNPTIIQLYSPSDSLIAQWNLSYNVENKLTQAVRTTP